MRKPLIGKQSNRNLGAVLMVDEGRGGWIRLRTLILLRWIAIIGQLAAIIVGQELFGLDLNLGLCLLAVGAAVVMNLVAIFVYPENQRLTENRATLMLVFDVIQLSALLYLTGGLNNPFALLILAPVTIAATALRSSSAIVVGIFAIVLVSVVLWVHVPLRTRSGFEIQMPDIFVFGFWAAITIGVVFLGSYAHRITSEINSMSEALLATQMALSREQKIADLTGVVAAAAHELGTPLATIKLTSSELMDELDGQQHLRDDAELIRDQADRCRDILRSMGRAGKQDLQIQYAPLTEVVRQAAEPHMDRGKDIRIAPNESEEIYEDQPSVLRRPEIIHGLRNLIQNAVDFAQTTVWVDTSWTEDDITIRVIDDGPGFSQHILGRIGDPFVRSRKTETPVTERPEYQGMGLGLFIAKTLLERAGANLSFANGRDTYFEADAPGEKHGAIVELVWPRSAIAETPDSKSDVLGENRLIET